MKEILVIFALVAVALAGDSCPADQDVNWDIELLLKHPYCHKFYKCTFGVPVEMVCPEDLYFNLDTWQCDWKYNVECGDRPEPGPTPDPDPEPTTPEPVTAPEPVTTPEPVPDPGPGPDPDLLENGCPRNPHIHRLLRNYDDCNAFYYCVWGEKVPRRCSNGLHFNVDKEVCDWPWHAGCSSATSYDKRLPIRSY